MSAITRPLTVADLVKLPDLPNGDWYELHHGELVQMTRPKRPHSDVQHRLYDLLTPLLGGRAVVRLELPFRAKAEGEFRVADVALVRRERWDAQPDEPWFLGAPDLVIEVLSPSNTYSEIRDKQQVCLSNGCRQFWTVDLDRKTVEVARPEGGAVIHRPGDAIPLAEFGGESLPVSEVFPLAGPETTTVESRR